MANAFDQFDAPPKANPFDAFDPPKANAFDQFDAKPSDSDSAEPAPLNPQNIDELSKAEESMANQFSTPKPIVSGGGIHLGNVASHVLSKWVDTLNTATGSEADANKDPEIMKLREKGDSPIVSLPKPSPAGAVSGAVRGIENTVEKLTTPENAVIMGALGGAPALVQKVAAAGFGVMMAHDAPAKIQEAMDEPTSAGKAEKITEGIADAVMAFGALKHAAGRGGRLATGVNMPTSLPDWIKKETGHEIVQSNPSPASVDGLLLAKEKAGEGFFDLSSEEQSNRRQIIEEIDNQLAGMPKDVVKAGEERVAQRDQSKPPAEGEAPPVTPVGPPEKSGTSNLFKQAKEEAGAPVPTNEPSPTDTSSEGESAKEGMSVGPGAASSAEDISNTLPSTGLKRAVVDTERLSRGAEPIPTPERQAEANVVSDAEDRLYNDPTRAKALVARIVDEGDKSISEHDAAELLVERRKVMNERNDWETRLGKGEDVEVAKTRLAEIENELDRLDRAQRAAGTQWGRIGHLYQREIRDDFSLKGMERKARAAKQGPLSEDELAAIKKQSEEIEKHQAELDKAAQEHADAQLDADTQATHDALVEDLKKPVDENGQKIDSRIIGIAEKIVKGLENQADSALKRIRARRAEGRVNSLPVDDLIDYSIYGAAKIARKGLDFTKWSAEMVKDLGDMSADVLKQVWDASHARIDELGKKTGKDAEKVTKALRKKSAQTPDESKAAAKAEAVAGEPLSHKVVFDYVKSLIQSGVHGVDPLMKAAHEGLKEHFPELTERDVRRAFSEYGKAKFPSKDAVKVELAETRRITQLQESIDRLKEGQDPLKSGLQREKATQQIREKQKELNELLKKHAGAPSPEKLASRDQAKQTALRNAIEDIDKQLRTGEKPAKGAPIPDSTQTEQLRAERDAMKAKLKEIEDAANPGKTDAERQEAALQKQLDNLNAEMAGKKAKATPTEWKALSQKAEDLRAQLDSVRQLKKELEAKPGKTVDEIEHERAQKGVDAAAAALDKWDRILKGEIERDPAKVKEWHSQLEEDMQQQVAAMKKAADEIRRSTAPKTDRDKAILKSLEKSIAHYERRVRDSDFSTKSKTPATGSAAVQAARGLRDAAKKVYDDLKKAQKPVKSPEQRYNETRLKQVEKRTDELEAKVKAGDFSKPAKPTPHKKINAVIEAETKLARAKDAFSQGVEKVRLGNRTKSQKFWDHFVGVERAMKLSSDMVIGKLTSAAIAREAVLTPLEEVVGGGISKVLPRLAARAPREGGLNIAAEIKAKREAFTNGMRDSWDNLRMQKSGLETLYGKERASVPSWYDYFGFLHGALKAPIKRAEFARSLEKRMLEARRSGEDLNNLETMGRLSQESYADAQRSIFMQDNVVADFFSQGFRMLENSKKAPNLGPGLARLGRFLIPIVKVPTNIVGEVATGVHGLATGSIRAATAYAKGIESLPKPEADSILRQLKKGAIGNALLLTGYFGYKGIGGFYQQKEKRSESDVKPGHYRIGSWDLPSFTSHSTGSILMNIGASVRREEIRKGLPSGLAAGARGTVEQLPFVPAMTNAMQALESDEGFQKYIRDLAAGSIVPAGVAHAAKIEDTPGSFPSNAFVPANKRYPKTIGQAVESQIPVLRKKVPLHR